VQAIKAALRRWDRSKLFACARQSCTRNIGAIVPSVRSSNLRVRKQFSDLDRDNFRHEGFDFLAKFFEESLAELARRNPNLAQRFQRVDANHFTATVYQSGVKVCVGSASLEVGSWAPIAFNIP